MALTQNKQVQKYLLKPITSATIISTTAERFISLTCLSSDCGISWKLSSHLLGSSKYFCTCLFLVRATPMCVFTCWRQVFKLRSPSPQTAFESKEFMSRGTFAQ